MRHTFIYVETGSFQMHFLESEERTEKDEKTFAPNRFYVLLIFVRVQGIYGKYMYK